MKKLLNSHLKLKVNIKKVTKIPTTGRFKDQICEATLSSKEERNLVLKEKKTLQDSGKYKSVYISPFKTKEQLAFDWQIRQLAKRRQNLPHPRPEHYSLRSGKSAQQKKHRTNTDEQSDLPRSGASATENDTRVSGPTRRGVN